MTAFVLPATRYRCTSCGDCCRGWDVPLTVGEGARFVEQMRPLLPAARLSELVRVQRRDGVARESLVGSGGACAALDEQQLCSVHARFGATAKPRACQLYPFRFLLTPTGVRVGLSFSCPAVVEAEGPTLEEQQGEIRGLYTSLADGAGAAWRLAMTDVALSRARRLSWPDGEVLLDAVARAFSDGAGGFVEKLARAGATAALVDEALGDGRSFADALAHAERERDAIVTEGLAAPLAIDGLSRSLFRTLVKASELSHVSALGRLGQTVGAWLGRGQLGVGTPGAPMRAVSWAAAKKTALVLDDASTTLLTRWLGVTLHSGFYFGAAAFDLPLLGGLDLLALVAAVALFVARGWAAADGRAQTEPADLRGAIRQVEAGILHRSKIPPGFARALDATASLDLLREQGATSPSAPGPSAES